MAGSMSSRTQSSTMTDNHSNHCLKHFRRLQAVLGLAFATQGVLLGFHLQGPAVESNCHVILVSIQWSTK